MFTYLSDLIISLSVLSVLPSGSDFCFLHFLVAPQDHGSPNPGNSTMGHVTDARGEEGLDQVQKRQKT